MSNLVGDEDGMKVGLDDYLLASGMEKYAVLALAGRARVYIPKDRGIALSWAKSNIVKVESEFGAEGKTPFEVQEGALKYFVAAQIAAPAEADVLMTAFVSKDETKSLKKAKLKALVRERVAMERLAQSRERRSSEGPAPWIRINEETGMEVGIECPILAEHLARTVPSMFTNERMYLYDEGAYKMKLEAEIHYLISQPCYIPLHLQSLKVLKEVRGLWEIAVQKKNNELNTFTHLLNVKNGMLNWFSRELIEHSPDYFSTIQLNARYDPTQGCPVIRQFLTECVNAMDDQVLYEFVGYSLLLDNKKAKSVMLTGTGNNGKSTFFDLLGVFFGDENISSVSLKDLAEHKFKRAELVDKVINIVADIGSSQIEDSAPFKAITTGDLIDAERKHEHPFKFRPTVKMIFSANTIPTCVDKTDAWYRRWIFVEFPNCFTGREDFDLPEKMSADEELSGFLNLALDGLHRLQAAKYFTRTENTKRLMEEYMETNDPVMLFASMRCEFEAEKQILRAELYAEYKLFCDENGNKPLGASKFYQRFLVNRPSVKEIKDRIGNRTFKGVILVDD